MNTSESLQLSLKKTLAYFDLANFPLTKEELYSFLWEPPVVKYPEFLLSLSELKFPVAEKKGLYFLSGRDELVETRRRRLLISENKLRIARRAARLVQYVPFLKAIFVCNTVASEQATEDSDIDFFIVTEKNRIWIVRLLVTFILGLFRLRRVGKRIKDKICLSFYVTVENLDLSNLRVIDDDIHFAYWVNQMLPIFDPDNLYDRFLRANSWTEKYLPNIQKQKAVLYIFAIVSAKIGSLWKKAWENMWQGAYGDIINNEAKKIQLSKMKFSASKKDRVNDKGVVVSDRILKFHEKDTRLEYRKVWLEKVATFLS